MSLFLEERIAEQGIADPENDQITFTFPWIISIADINRPVIGRRFRTCFEMENEGWAVLLLRHRIIVTCSCLRNKEKYYRKIWGGSCYVSYVLYQDNDMLIDLYSSTKVEMEEDTETDWYDTSPEFLTKFDEAVKEKSAAKAVFFVELVLPSKPFYYPFERTLSKTYCNVYPTDVESDQRFSFLNKGDFTIICSDGSVNAFRTTLYTSSGFMNNRLTADFKDRIIAVDLSVELVKPMIIFFHTFCFEMPEVYDLEYAERLLDAINYFQPYQRDVYNIKEHVHQSLCNKFVNESHNFDSILRWTSIACQHSLHELSKMVISTIAGKYYFKWSEVFPLDERNIENQLYRDVFGTEAGAPHKIFQRIDKIVRENLCTNVIVC